MNNREYTDSDIQFWIIEESNNNILVKIDQTLILDFLMQKGFFKIYLNSNSIFIRIQDNIISEVSNEQIKDYVLRYVRDASYSLSDKVSNTQIETALIRGNNIYFGKSLLQCLQEVNPEIKTDDIDTAYFYFKNCFVKVTNEKIHVLPYSELDHLIWKNQIIDNNFQLNDEISDFELFLKNISKNDETRYLALLSSIGYLLHSYKDPTITKAVIYCDETLTLETNGRTGKSLVGKAIAKLKKTETIDGKSFDFNQRFTYQQVNLDTQVINFNDVKKNFNFEALFSVLTDGITVEKKGRKPFNIPFKDAPKILISTNYAIIGDGDSFKDRMFEIEFSNHYSLSHAPVNDFKKRFFEDWNESEWDSFFTFMIKSVQYYLKSGFISYEPINLNRKKLEQITSSTFCLFADKIELSKEYDKKELYESYLQLVPNFFFKQRTFDSYLKLYAAYNNLNISERKSAGKQFIKLSYIFI